MRGVRAFASSLSAWQQLEEQEGVRVPHGLTFPLAVVAAIGQEHGLETVAEEHADAPASSFDAVFVSVMDSRCMLRTAEHFARWRVPMLRRDRDASHPLVWAGGQGLHNPMPYADIADLIVLGDAEGPLPELLRAWDATGGDRALFLSRAAQVSGVYVPALHGYGETPLRQSVADDVSITLRHEISVNLNGQRRIEIARGCRYKCAFCSLGWRTPVRENSSADVVSAIRASGQLVHLQAGDAESHSGISEIRAALREHGGRDAGWTGRLDTLLENPDVEIDGGKKYAFGVEGVSWRLRRAVGKGYLTDDRLASDTLTFFGRVDSASVGRGAWHVISGLPTERASEALEMLAVLERINDGLRGRRRRNLTLHWQPFQPLPGTPMQWCGAGGGARRLASMLRGAEHMDWLGVRQLVGRTDDVALVCTILSRADRRGADLLTALGAGRVSARDAERIAGVGSGPLDPDAPLPWDWIETRYPRAVLRRAYGVMLRRLESR